MSPSLEVVSVNVSEKKGHAPSIPVGEIVVDDLGLRGDAHAGPWQRQVSLLSVESIHRFADSSGRTFAPATSAKTLPCEGWTPAARRCSTAFAFRMWNSKSPKLASIVTAGCSIFQQVGKCVMPVKEFFPRAAGGVLRPGDRGEHVVRKFRFLIITVSDRAAAGLYADRSGPKSRQLLEAVQSGQSRPIEIEMALTPDDPERLRRHLIAAKESGVDVVFTTGGTGVRPARRDARNGRRRLRSNHPRNHGVCPHQVRGEEPQRPAEPLDGGRGRPDLRWTVLPGSVRAVGEYMEETPKTLEHLIYMMHGLDVH